MSDNHDVARTDSFADWLAQTRSTLDRLAVPENVIRTIPAIVALFGVVGLPAAGVAFTSLLGAGIYAANKQREFEQAIRREMHGAVGEVEAEVDAVSKSVDELRSEVAELALKLSAQQVEQLGTIFEEYMASLDEDWLEHLRKAVRGVVADEVASSTRKAVLARLRMLGPAHVRALTRVADEVERNGNKPRQLRRSDAQGEGLPVFSVEVQVVLESAGFIERGQRLRVAAEDTDWTDTEIGITPLGAAAVELLCESRA